MTDSRKLTGHFNYYGITDNKFMLGPFYQAAISSFQVVKQKESKEGFVWGQFSMCLEHNQLSNPRVAVESSWLT